MGSPTYFNRKANSQVQSLAKCMFLESHTQDIYANTGHTQDIYANTHSSGRTGEKQRKKAQVAGV